MRHISLNVIAAFCLFCFFTLGAKAQQDPAFAQYWKLETEYNPAAAGRTPQLVIDGAYQLHNTGFDDAGGTMFASVNTAFDIGKTRHGVGVIFQNDLFGLFSHKRISAQYAYHTRLFGGTFSIGVEADLMAEGIEGSKAEFAEGNDLAFPSADVTGNKVDASVGLFYQIKRFYAGASVLHLSAPAVRFGEQNEMKWKRLYNFTAGYNIRTRSPFITIVPSVMFRTDLTDYRADITARLQYANDKKRLYGGASYSPGHSATLFIGGTLQGIDLCYSYEANTQGIGLESGQHEITLGYRLDLNLGKRGRNLHRSVRWL
ncbi:MAG: PorP/SprF family type IX secretion system membrane protein [Bacteroidales bacterium]|nr:PorP/SprF family type IX secretion system membrane protein [Candidatus Equimonas enterica]